MLRGAKADSTRYSRPNQKRRSAGGSAGGSRSETTLLDLRLVSDENGELVPGGAVFSLLPALDERHGAAQSAEHGEKPVASVAVVLSPSGLAVWAPKEEVHGLLALLDAEGG